MNDSLFFAPLVRPLLDSLSLALPRIDVQHTLAGAALSITSSVLPGRKVSLVADEFTYHALGKRIEQELQAEFELDVLILPKDVRADLARAVGLKQQCLGSEAIIAVGSGTINDLCKYAAHLLKIPYVVFPTAASMNGYLSANASLVKDGLKQSFAASLPKGVFCDCEVIGRAPVRLTRSGFGDSLARSTAQADWLFSHLLLDTAYVDEAFQLTAPYEEELFVIPHLLDQKDNEAIAVLMRVLLLSGIAMTLCKGSYPASQGEHMIAHAYEMLTGDHETYHGEQIGVTTLVMAQHQHKMLEREQAPFLLPATPPDKVLDDVPGNLRVIINNEMAHKIALYDRMDGLQHQLQAKWPEMRERIAKVTVAPEKIEKLLLRAKAPHVPKELDWDARVFNQAFGLARFTRNRFTFLELG